jgi:putative colanic acid biosynthesis UDP-glucose lipid carrier transferase
MQRSILKAHANLLELALRLADPAMVIAAALLAHRRFFGSWTPNESYWLAILGVAVLSVALFPLLRVYEPQRGVSLAIEVRNLLSAWALLAAVVFATFFVTKSGAEFSRVWTAMWLSIGFLVHLAARIALRLLLRDLRRRGYNQRHIVIVGAGTLGREVVARLKATAWSGFSVRGFYDDDPALAGQWLEGVPVLGSPEDLLRDIGALKLDQVWIALPLRAEDRIKELLGGLQQVSVQVSFVPDIYGFHLINHSVSEVAGLPIINLNDTPLAGINAVLKTIEDYVLASVLLLVLAPLMALIALAIRLDSRGPLIYRQQRLTWNGSTFTMLKFRTMPVDAERETGPVWATRDRPRATRVGRVLRRYSLDELPQLVNVLRGQMSLVGPRPERPEFVERFRAEIPGYMQKHLVKAGITGWAQVNDLRGDSDLHKRIEYDLYYIENWSVWFDVRVLALTLVKVALSRHAY